MVLSPDDPNYQQSQMVTQMQTATYENTLMINNITDTDGLYTCSVFNMMGYSSGTSGMGGEFKSSCIHVCQ